MHFAPPQHVSKSLFLFRIQSLIQLDGCVIFFQGKNQPQEVTENQRDVQNAIWCFTILSGEQIMTRVTTCYEIIQTPRLCISHSPCRLCSGDWNFSGHECDVVWQILQHYDLLTCNSSICLATLTAHLSLLKKWAWYFNTVIKQYVKTP